MVRPSLCLISFIMCGILLLGLLFKDAVRKEREAAPSLLALRKEASSLAMTDLALCTEARYTRHLSQADYHAPFQDSPAAPDHFPSGSLFSPPRAPR